MADKMLDKIAALLKKAETTTNEAEAEAYLTHAQTLATRYSVDLAVARQATAKREQREQPTQRQIKIGVRGAKALKHYVGLFLNIANTQGVTCNIAHNSTYVIAFGMPSDIDVAEILYGSLVTQMVTSAEAYLKSGEYKKETVNRYNCRTYRWEYKPVDGRVARASFYDAFRSRVTVRLREAAESAKEALKGNLYEVLDDNDNVESVGSEIVLARKDVEVHNYYQAHSRARGSWKGASRSGFSSRAHNAGDHAGSTARIGAQASIGGGSRALAG